MSNFNLKVAIYPGSFNPFHKGHLDVVKKALKLFDTVIIAKGVNPEKEEPDTKFHATADVSADVQELVDNDKVELAVFDCLLSDYVNGAVDHNCDLAIIKGIRQGFDLEDEKMQLYWNEDLGMTIPTFYIITDRTLAHVSSTAIRHIDKFEQIKKEKENASDDDS